MELEGQIEGSMTESLVGPILALLIAAWGFSIMLRPFVGGGGRRDASGYPYQRRSSGFFGRFFLAFVFSVALPVVWWTVALVGRMYQRTFVVFTEFLTGVHDWNTYRTSSLKYAGATFAFLGFNGLLFLVLSLVASSLAGGNVSAAQLVVVLASSAGCGLVARTAMRRMP
ncbi:MAG: hypothetical protein WC815_04055 [Vicinamibacterales bacterium]|jgi:hypothetical protein